jgi:YD repeat-containing protein
LLYIENGKGELWIRNTLNDHGDIILYESWKDGELDSKSSTEYEYDADGNIVTEVTEYWSKNNDGEEESFTSVHTYEYEEHGLLISEVDMIGEKFMSMTVYSYEAILVPQT